ncbi:uncharacterized protein LOC128215930 [Mya arenaria]|uniref:uncharacterized protein LOC128215930 n=1 Tax=Mya arenaria TaxID=6604 RepID=UPI0022E5E790|nr:uncharacterized protein LOC128215930 [Mya arenaria]
MYYGQPFQYGINPQSPGVFPASTPQSNAPPPWALEIMSDIKSIKTVIPKIDQIEQALGSIKLKLSAFDERMSSVERKVNDIEKACSFVSEENDSRKTEVNSIQKQVKQIDKFCKNADSAIHSFQQEAERAKEELLDMKARSMRDNLLFYGVSECAPENNENCEELIKDLIKLKLQLETEGMIFDRAHRLGAKAADKTRPIVVKFHNYKSREAVRLKSLEKTIKDALKSSGHGIGVQSPQEYRDARKAFYPIVKDAEEHGNTARITGNKLYINRK